MSFFDGDVAAGGSGGNSSGNVAGGSGGSGAGARKLLRGGPVEPGCLSFVGQTGESLSCAEAERRDSAGAEAVIITSGVHYSVLTSSTASFQMCMELAMWRFKSGGLLQAAAVVLAARPAALQAEQEVLEVPVSHPSYSWRKLLHLSVGGGQFLIQLTADMKRSLKASTRQVGSFQGFEVNACSCLKRRFSF